MIAFFHTGAVGGVEEFLVLLIWVSDSWPDGLLLNKLVVLDLLVFEVVGVEVGEVELHFQLPFFYGFFELV
jgi:hypothetical protein